MPALNRAITEMAIHDQNARKDIELLWVRVDEGKTEHDALEEEIDVVDGRVSETKSTAKGAMWDISVAQTRAFAIPVHA